MKYEGKSNIIHIDKVENLVGLAAEHSIGKQKIEVINRGIYISDQPEFHKIIDQLSGIFLSKAKVPASNVYHFLVLIHKDLSADLYINEFKVIAKMRAKRDLEFGEIIGRNDIADISRLKFPDIKIEETDKVIYCFKVGWKFGLFFDLERKNNLNLDEMEDILGSIYRYLSFQNIYIILETKLLFKEMSEDGWFPFIEIIGTDYDNLVEIYKTKDEFEIRIKVFVDSFNEDRIKKIIKKWWSNNIFKDKQALIKAGIDAYLLDKETGFINCIKTLTSEVEGIIRIHYFKETGKGKKVCFSHLTKHVREQGREKSGSDFSLYLVRPFFDYLENIFFADFNLEKGDITLSRHSSSHGVAKPEDYHKIKAIQTILVLDQIYFYLSQ